MTATEYVVGLGSRWTPAAGRKALSEAALAALPDILVRARETMLCDQTWLANRLTVMWLAAGNRKDPRAAASWLIEMGRLLGDIPTDILADAIDEALRRSTSGFMPSAGAICELARPATEARRSKLRRIEAMIAHETPALPARKPEYVTAAQAASIIDEFGLRTLGDELPMT